MDAYLKEEKKTRRSGGREHSVQNRNCIQVSKFEYDKYVFSSLSILSEIRIEQRIFEIKIRCIKSKYSSN